MKSKLKSEYPYEKPAAHFRHDVVGFAASFFAYGILAETRHVHVPKNEAASRLWRATESRLFLLS